MSDFKSNSIYSAAGYYVKRLQGIFENKYYEDAFRLNDQMNDSGLLFALDLVVPLVDLVISIRTNLLMLIRSDLRIQNKYEILLIKLRRIYIHVVVMCVRIHYN